MTGILAIDTATEACSIALWRDGQVQECHEITPRQHSQRLFGMLRELLPNGQLREQGIEALAWGCGPGSFTGLRIAASAIQGLAFANDLPVVSVSTLACQAQTAFRTGLVAEGGAVLSTLDARINEIYSSSYRIESGVPVALTSPVACSPSEVQPGLEYDELVAVGNGCEFSGEFPQALKRTLMAEHPQLVPHAQDLIPLALRALDQGDVLAARDVQPLYVRDEINWKKIPEQGKRT